MTWQGGKMTLQGGKSDVGGEGKKDAARRER